MAGHSRNFGIGAGTIVPYSWVGFSQYSTRGNDEPPCTPLMRQPSSALLQRRACSLFSLRPQALSRQGWARISR